MLKHNLKTIRQRAKVSQINLAKLTGINISTIRRYEQNHNRSITLDHLEILSKELGCHWSELIKEEIECL